MQRFQLLYSRAGAQMPAKLAPAVFMDTLIDRELLAQKAMQLKLDHDVGVALALSDAQANILARAYIEHALGSSPEDPSAVTTFYDQHPEFFAERRIYRILELAVVAAPERLGALKERVRRAHGLHEVAAWLRKENLLYNAGGVTKASEELAPNLLSRIAALEAGQMDFIEVPGGASVVQLLQADAAPLSRDAAAPVIEQLLRSRKRIEVAERERKYLRSNASIEYVIDLGGARPIAQAKAKAPAENFETWIQ